ncbi:formin-like protein 11 [Cajanus cajan]|uniref:Formin-like protein n=1 Tax=Cajanus cajan TaxID=3821 RepID=A0A151U4U0_CAJCA|nr:formin-like protein 11 [Cajanus cajan]KYP74316.1 Formin-like protein 11 [Cajanus cajan]
MACGSEHFTMIFVIITLLVLLSSQRTHILTLFNAVGSFQAHVIQENNEKQIEKISGLDENEEKQALIVEKFRSLIGLKSFHTKVPSNGDLELLSPSPSPSPFIEESQAPSPSPSPVPHVHPHYHPRHHKSPPLHKTHHEDRGRAKRILIAILVSAGVATLIGACGLFLVWRRLTNQAKKPKRTMPLCSSKSKEKGGAYQSSSSKVSLNSGLDLFYLNALGEDIEQHACNLNKTCKEGLEYDNVSGSSTKEIASVHEDVESVTGEDESDGGNSSSGDRIVPEDCHSSDNESFHSFVDSHSNNRLSNASAGSITISDTQSLTHSPNSPKHEEIENSVQCPKSLTSPLPPPPPPSPPPPPPPPLQMPLFSLHSLTSLSRVSSHSPLSLTSNNLSSPINSDTFSGSNQSPDKELPSPHGPYATQSPPNIPPPPCPPPFLKGNSHSSKTPPPPPSQFPQFTPLGKDGAPLPKLKPLHWDKVRAAPNRTMVWDKLRSSSFELDEEMIESLFGYNLQNSIKNDETKSKTPSPSKHVLEPKRLQNITILSKALNATAEHVCDEALMQGKGLSLPQLEALVKMVPTKEEESKLINYKGDINELGSAERFVRSMLEVPFAFQRVEGMLFRETFDDEVVHLRNSFSMLEEACKELRSSRLFLKLLEAVLKTGNRMNVGTIRGGARAFKLDALLKLSDVKGTDGKTTLLHFVVQEIVRAEGIKVSDSIMGKISQRSKNRTEEEKEEDYKRMGLELVSGLSTELYNVKKTATIDLDVLASSVSNLSEGMAKLQRVVEELHGDERSVNFVRSMKWFLNYGDGNLKELRGDEDRVLARVKEITEYFHGDVVSKEDVNPLRIFVIVRDFLGMLDNVCKELRRSKASRSPNPLVMLPLDRS